MSESVKENYSMCCPNCGDDEQLDVCAKVWVRLCDNGTDAYESDNGYQEWVGGSLCSCNACGHVGTVSSFAVNIDFESFVMGYVACALWSSNDESDPETGGDPMDANYEIDDITVDSMQRIRADCALFYNAHSCMIQRQAGDAGHDFWLTRNGHGAGFWDGDWSEPFATILTNASKAAGGFNLYVGDDGCVYGDIA